MPQIIELDVYWIWNIALKCSVPLIQLLHVLKAVENAGAAVSDLILTLSRCVQNQSVPLELRLAAVRAFRRIPCLHDVSIIEEFKIYIITLDMNACADRFILMFFLLWHDLCSCIMFFLMLSEDSSCSSISKPAGECGGQNRSISAAHVQTRRFSQLWRQLWAMRSLVKVLIK